MRIIKCVVNRPFTESVNPVHTEFLRFCVPKSLSQRACERFSSLRFHLFKGCNFATDCSGKLWKMSVSESALAYLTRDEKEFPLL